MFGINHKDVSHHTNNGKKKEVNGSSREKRCPKFGRISLQIGASAHLCAFLATFGTSI
jgi:hypothetical protein